MSVISPCIHSEIFWSTYLLSDVYVCSIALYFYELCRIFTSTKGAFRANSNIFQFFRESKLAKFLRCQNFGGSLIKPVNFEQNFTDWLIRQSQTYLAPKRKKKSLANCYARTGPFSRKIFCVLVDACATRAGFDTCNGRRIYCWSHMFSTLLPV